HPFLINSRPLTPKSLLEVDFDRFAPCPCSSGPSADRGLGIRALAAGLLGPAARACCPYDFCCCPCFLARCSFFWGNIHSSGSMSSRRARLRPKNLALVSWVMGP